MILLKKTIEEIMEETLKEAEGMGITETDAGGVCRLLLYLINKRLAAFYDTLDLNIAQAFVSNATGFFLDKIGQLLDCKRNTGESDDDFRFRITKQIQSVASGNYTAVRLAILSVPGVQDVKLQRFTHGAGSFSAYVISADPITPQTILDAVNEKINNGIESFGIRAEAFRPIIIPVEMKIRLIFNKTVTDLDKRLAIAQAQEEVKKYVNSRNVGEPLEIKEIDRRIRAINEGIEEILIFHFKVSNRPALITDQTCAWNERFVESDKPNAIQVM